MAARRGIRFSAGLVGRLPGSGAPAQARIPVSVRVGGDAARLRISAGCGVAGRGLVSRSLPRRPHRGAPMSDLVLGQDWLRPVHHAPGYPFAAGLASIAGIFARQAALYPDAPFLTDLTQS